MSDRTSDAAATARRVLRTPRGREFELPMFLPVCQLNGPFVPIETWQTEYGISGCIVNAYFLYKDRSLREAFSAGLQLRDYVNLDGLLVTDSGAFQGFARRLLLSNEKIVRFQEMIGADVSSPLDLVTPPGDGRAVAESKLEATLKRIRRAQPLVSQSILAGVQQGGRFLDLRRRSVERLVELDVKYLAIGSMVPFFTRNHDLSFVGPVLRQARALVGPDLPMHVYGAGDPVELPFFAALGADIFDSSSYGHFARRQAYMTPYGALADAAHLQAGEYCCGCHVCRSCQNPADVWADEGRLSAHNLWTICDTMRRLREALARGELDRLLAEVLDRHTAWFPDSQLKTSWEALHE